MATNQSLNLAAAIYMQSREAERGALSLLTRSFLMINANSNDSSPRQLCVQM